MTARIHIAYDDTSIGLIPADAQWIGVYIDGRYVNVDAVRKAFPNAVVFTITALGAPGADFCDCESGDLTPAQAVTWVLSELKAGRTPGIYASVSTMIVVLGLLARVGVGRGQVILWTAHYTGVPHICSPSSCAYPGFDATADGTQFTDTADGRSLDESEVTDRFLRIKPPAPKPKPKPAPPPADPHYDRFPTGPFRLKGSLLNERAVVQSYDRLRALETPTSHPNRPELAVLRAQLGLLAGRVWTVAHIPGLGGWASNHRGWRFQQLIHRAHGDRLA